MQIIVDIETEWNLKSDCCPLNIGCGNVDIETEWNLKLSFSRASIAVLL